jgi:endonuclease/exonuclease/phosphatase (EEP) superfamily protein YafD
LILTFAPLIGRTRFKYCELASHFRLQLFIAAAVSFVFFIISNSWLWVGLAFIAFAFNAFEIFPVYFNKPKQQNNPNSATLRLIFANVLYQNKKYEPFINLIRKEKPDIFVGQEVTAPCLQALETLCEFYPYHQAKTEKHGGGIVVFSRFPFVQAEIISLGFEHRQSILVKFKLDDKIVTLYTFHPQAPLAYNHFGYRNQQLTNAAEIIKELSEPIVVVGDLNTTPWSPFYKRFLKETKLLNARQGFGLLPTFPVFKFPIAFLMMPIDHCFVSEDISVQKIRTCEYIGSDHLPLAVELNTEIFQ